MDSEYKLKYDTSGIYIIIANHTIVYCGKSNDIKWRWKQHSHKIVTNYKNIEEKKYKYLHELFYRQYPIYFMLLEECPVDKLNERERSWIKFLKPCLNSMNNNNACQYLSFQDFFNIILNTRDSITITRNNFTKNEGFKASIQEVLSDDWLKLGGNGC